MRYERSLRAVMLCSFLAAVVGCGGGAVSNEPAEPSVTATEVTPPEHIETGTHEPIDLAGAWLLEDLGGRGVMDMVQTTLAFDGEGRASGSGGCNRFTGSYTFTDGELVFGPLAGTKKMCPEAVMDQEDRFMQALGAAGRVEMDGSFLLISSEGSKSPLRFTRMEPDVID